MPYLYGGCVAAVGPIKIRLSDTALSVKRGVVFILQCCQSFRLAACKMETTPRARRWLRHGSKFSTCSPELRGRRGLTSARRQISPSALSLWGLRSSRGSHKDKALGHRFVWCERSEQGACGCASNRTRYHSSELGASAASRKPAVALATARVTIQASWVRA